MTWKLNNSNWTRKKVLCLESGSKNLLLWDSFESLIFAVHTNIKISMLLSVDSQWSNTKVFIGLLLKITTSGHEIIFFLFSYKLASWVEWPIHTKCMLKFCIFLTMWMQPCHNHIFLFSFWDRISIFCTPYHTGGAQM